MAERSVDGYNQKNQNQYQAKEQWLLRTGVSQLCEAGQIETDKWPLELVRPRGKAKSVPRVRRGGAGIF